MSAAWLALVSLAGCNDSGKPTAAPTSTTRSVPTTGTSTTSSVTEGPAAEIVARYKMFWQVRFEANQPPPNPDLPGLADYATGQQLDKVRTETRDNLQQGLAVRHGPSSGARSSVKVLDVAGDEATVQECVVDDGVRYRFSSGEVVDDSVSTHSVRATMERVDGAWKLAAARLLQEWKGVAGCALSKDFSQ